jgi:hypothetical protein
MLVGMGEVVDLDQTLYQISDLPPGWCAERKSVDNEWNKYKDENI